MSWRQLRPSFRECCCLLAAGHHPRLSDCSSQSSAYWAAWAWCPSPADSNIAEMHHLHVTHLDELSCLRALATCILECCNGGTVAILLHCHFSKLFGCFEPCPSLHTSLHGQELPLKRFAREASASGNTLSQRSEERGEKSDRRNKPRACRRLQTLHVRSSDQLRARL